MKKFRAILLYLGIIMSSLSCHSGTDLPVLPSFNLLLSDSATIFNTQSIPEGKPSILLFFSPDCDHCQSETAGIIKNMDSLRDVNFYFLTIDPIERLKVFNEYYDLSKYTNIKTGRDYKYYFPAHFKGASPPYLVIYDAYKRQRAIFSGQTDTWKIIAFLNQM